MKTAVEMPSANVIEAVQIVGNKGSFSEVTTGSHTKISVKAGEKFRLKKSGADSIADDVIALKEGDTLSLQYADGTQISLEGFYTSQGAEIELFLSDGASHTIESSDIGITLSDGSSLVYSHGNTSTLMGMVSQNETLQTALANNTSLGHLDRYAELATGVATDATAGGAVAGSATTAATAGGLFTGMSTGVMVGLGALGVGVVAVAAGGGGGGSSAPAAPADTTAPVLTGVLAHGVSKTVVLTYGETLDASHPPLSTSFAITTGGVANVITAVAVSGTTVTLTLTSAFSAGDAVVISYNGSGVNAIQDASGNDAVAITSLSSGAVADGYVRGAQIWIDTNHDGVQDYNTGITTDESGNFFLPPGTPSGSIVAIGGVNIDTGVANTMPLRAPEGSTVINPLTTLVQAIIQANPSTSVSDASTSVVAALGLTTGTNLTTYDPIEAAQSSDPTVAANALVAQQAAATVATIITLAAESASDSTAATTATNTIISNIVTQIQASETSTVVLDLGDSTTMSNMTAGVTLSNEVQSAIADASTAIQAATVLSEITTAQSVALDTIAVSASTITATAITADTTPAIKVNLNTTSTDGTAAISGDTVLLKADGVQIATATLTEIDVARGYITLNSPVLSEGVHAISAVIVDQAGNIGTPYPSVNVTVDTTPTTPSTINRIATDDIINLAEKTAGVTLNGTIASGSTVTVEGHAATVTGTSWSYTLTAGDYTVMGEGAETIDVRVTAANATFADSTRNITIDTIVPTAPIINAVSIDNAINASEKAGAISISGSAEANALITLTLGVGNIHAVNADGSGTWTYALTAADYTSIGTGTTITATAKDAAGNVSATASQAITVDTGAPLLTVNSIASDNIINSIEKAATVTVTGVNEAGSTVTVNGASATVTGTTWSYVLDVSAIGTMGEGSETLTIVTTDAAGNATTRTKTINVDTIIATPTTVLTTDSGTSATDNITNSAALTFNTAAVDVTRSFVVDGGSASATYVAPTADGSHTVTVTDTDTAGNTTTLTKTLMIDTIVPTFTSGTTSTVSENTTTAVYTAVATGAATYSLGGTDAALFNVDSVSGAATFKVAPDYENPANGNTDNIYDITVTATDTAGNTSNQAIAITVQNVDVTISNVATDNVISAAEKAAGVTLTGNNEPGITSLTVNGAAATVNGTSWSYALDTAAITAMGEGPETLTIISGGTTITKDITIDTVASTLSIGDVSTANIINNAEALNGGPITGTTNAEDGCVVTVKVDGTTLGTTTVTAGVWSFTVGSNLTTLLSQGNHAVTAEVSDLAGNPTTATKIFAVDTLAPTITISAITTDDILNTAEIAAGGAISGTTTAEDGRIVTVKINGFDLGTATVASGAWSFPVSASDLGTLTQGSYSITADVSDTAGNPAIQATHTFSVDSVAPTGTISNASSDNILNATENVPGNKTVTGTSVGAETGSAVAFKVDGIEKGTSTVNADGTWTINYTTTGSLTEGTHTRTAEITDLAGNVGTVSKTVTVDMTAPTIASTTPITTNDLDASGTYSAGDTISIKLSEASIGLTLADLSISNMHTLGAGATLSTTDNITYTITLGSGTDVVEADTITIASGSFTDIALNPSANNIVYTLATPADTTAPDTVILSSTLTAPEMAITAFPVGTTFTDGYVTMVFSSTTAGTITEPNGLVHNLTLANGIASASVGGTTYNYKILSGSGDMIILGQTDIDLTVEMNGATQGPPPIWTLISTTAAVDPFPSSGIMMLWATSTDNFGDQNGATWAKTVFDFTNHTAQDYFIDGTADTIQTFTVDTATNTMHIAATASNSRTSDIQLMGGYNGFYAFESHYTDSYAWGQNSAGGSADMSAYLTAHSDILWSENGYDNNGNGTLYDYGTVTRTSGIISGFTEYASSNADHSGATENWSAVSATLSNGALVIDEGDRTRTYSIVNNEINITQVGTEVFSFTTANPFSYTYAYEMNMGNGTVGVGLHDAMALNVGDLNYNHTLYGIDSAQDTGVNAITITPADVLAQGVSDGQGHYGIGINKGDNDSVTLTGWTDTTQDVSISGIMYSVYTDNTQVAQLYISNSAPL